MKQRNKDSKFDWSVAFSEHCHLASLYRNKNYSAMYGSVINTIHYLRDDKSTRILVWTRQETSTGYNISGAFAFSFCLDNEFIVTFQKSTNYYNTHCMISACRDNRFTIDHRWDMYSYYKQTCNWYLTNVDIRYVQSITFDTHLFLQSQLVPHRKRCNNYSKLFLGLQRVSHWEQSLSKYEDQSWREILNAHRHWS